MQLKPGTFLQGDKYRIIRMLGSGGFGITYLAEHVMAKHKVCIKEFFPKEYYNRDEDSCSAKLGSEGSAEMMNIYKAKFIKEAQIIASLNHPNIIHIHDVFTENNTAYYVMEYIAGESLKDVVKLRGTLPEAEAVKYIRAVSKAVEYIHERRIMHLDIKPANVMLRAEDDCPILIDFGISKHYDENSGEATSKTPVGKSRGFTPMEQYKEGGVNTFSPETDIYSLGATLYYLVTGAIPPQASDVLEDGLPALPSHLSAGVRLTITTAMQSRRKDRPRSIAEFLGLLDFVDNTSEMDTYSECTIPDAVASEAIVADIKKPQPEPKRNEPKPQPEPKWSNDNKHIELKNASTTSKRWFVWVIVALLAIGVGITLFTSNNKPTDEAKPSVSDENLVIVEAVDEVAVEGEYTTLTPPNNEIWYTSRNGKIVKPRDNVFGVNNIVSNTYENGKGIITFDSSLKTIGVMAFDFDDSLTSVTIPNSVTTIGDGAFYWCLNLTSVTIPDSVTTIGDGAFDNCTSLTNVTIPNSVTTIGRATFQYCTSLTHITIPDSVTTIGEEAFYNCDSLTSVTIGDSVTTIGYEAFYDCDSLTSVTIGDSVVSIGGKTFFDCSNLTNVTIPDSVTTIGDGAFAGCTGLTSITIPDSVTTIGDVALSSCSNLTSVTIGDSVTTIGDGAFYSCSNLTSVTIGDSVTTIGDEAFRNCSNLTNIYCKATTPPTPLYDSYDDYSESGDHTIYVPRKSVGAYKDEWWYAADDIVGYDF